MYLLESNLFGTLIGWLAFNALMWKLKKNKHDKKHEPFPFKQYARETVDEWIVSLIFVPLILWVGYRSLALNPFATGLDVAHADWSDLYYLCAGFAPELAVNVLTKLGIIKNENENPA